MKEYSRYIIIGLTISIILILAFNVWLLLAMQQRTQEYENTIASLQAEVNRQRSDKDTIQGLWEEQAAQTDQLITIQNNLINRINDYLLEVRRSVRFVNSNPEILPTISEERLTNKQDSLNFEVNELQTQAGETAVFTNEAKERIDTLYLQAGEEQDNRANPRED